MPHLNRRRLLGASVAMGLIGKAASAADRAAQDLASPDRADDAKALAPRVRRLFDFDWRFHLGHAADENRDFGFGRDQKTFAKQGQGVALPAAADFDDSGWTQVDLPHDWAVGLPFARNDFFTLPSNPEDGDPTAGHGYKAIGRRFPENSIGWYRKVFTLEPGDDRRRLSLEFEGVFRDAYIILNNYILTRHESGYTSFSVDITDFVNADGPNVLLVRADASLGEGWFYEGAGIYRHVWLVKTDPVHVPQWGVWARGEVSGSVRLDIETRNDADADAQIIVTSRLFDAAGHIAAEVASPVSLAAHSQATVTQAAQIAKPHLWSLDDPHLYTVRTELSRDGQLIDAVVTRFGLRDMRFDAQKGFFLNGQWLKIRGTNNHQDHAGVGVALTDTLHRWRVSQLKAMGANAWRCSHNPPAPALLDACDELGVLVIDETRMMTSTPEGLDQLAALIRRDRNHPSIMLWSIGNEETAQQGTERGLKIAQDMRRVVKTLDPTRPVTAAMNHHAGYGITPALDVMGFNYHEQDIEPFRKLYPDMPIIGTETASAVSTRGEYVRDDVKGYVRAYDLDAPSYAKTAEAWWSFYNARPYLSGGLVWTGFDYRGEPTPFNRWPEISSHFGILDTCGFPKDIYWYYKSWWQDEPVLHVLPHWNWAGKEGQTIPVWVYTNLDSVELFVNGKSLGRKPCAKDSHIAWDAVYQPGEIVAYGYRGDKVVQKARRQTAGAAARLSLSCDHDVLRADGQDVALIRVEALDGKDIPAPTASDLIRFAVNGPGDIVGVGNGDPTSLEADKASERRLFNGLAQVIIRTRKDQAGELRLAASMKGQRFSLHLRCI
ncbi:MAG: beta-galactosidase GalA [Asticcacaulis sp.]|uniref:beta-galactosidase GalA n=1 Tax=Asticcacaulis sp. TaxID=1872648 RepID=UPI003F7BF0D0